MEGKLSAQVPTHPAQPFQLLAGRVDSTEDPSAADGRTRTVRTKRTRALGTACGAVNKFFFRRNSVIFQGALGLRQQESEARSLHAGGTIAVEPQGAGRGLGNGAP